MYSKRYSVAMPWGSTRESRRAVVALRIGEPIVSTPGWVRTKETLLAELVPFRFEAERRKR